MQKRQTTIFGRGHFQNIFDLSTLTLVNCPNNDLWHWYLDLCNDHLYFITKRYSTAMLYLDPCCCNTYVSTRHQLPGIQVAWHQAKAPGQVPQSTLGRQLLGRNTPPLSAPVQSSRRVSTTIGLQFSKVRDSYKMKRHRPSLHSTILTYITW